jgi:hypothetical protein
VLEKAGVRHGRAAKRILGRFEIAGAFFMWHYGIEKKRRSKMRLLLLRAVADGHVPRLSGAGERNRGKLGYRWQDIIEHAKKTGRIHAEDNRGYPRL